MEKAPEKKIVAIPPGPRKLNVKTSSRHSLQIDARALLPGTRPPKPQQPAPEASAALAEDGTLEISSAAPAIADEALRGSKQRIAIKPKRAARAKSMFVTAAPTSDDGWNDEEEQQQVKDTKEEEEEEGGGAAVDSEAVAAAPEQADEALVEEAATLAAAFPDLPTTKAPARPVEQPAKQPAAPVTASPQQPQKQQPLKIASKPVAPSTAANLANLWDDEAPQKVAAQGDSGAFSDIFAETKPKGPPMAELIKPPKEEDIFGGDANFLTNSKSTTDFFSF